MPAGDAVLELLPVLRRALSGAGPALLPVPAADPRCAEAPARALAAGTPLEASEDDDADPTAFVVTTSGSTGAPKGALLPAAALIASARATRSFLAGDDPRPAHWLLALPAHHVAGLQVLLRSVVEGTGPTVLDTSLPFTAGRFADAAGRMPAGVRFVSLVPTQLQRILADDESAAALAGFDAALIGGAPASPALLDRATAAGVRAVTTYGMSETCGGCVYDGHALGGVTVSTDEAGRISLAGPVVARGYRGLPRHPAFDLDPAGRRRFRTDDIGEFVTDEIGDRWRVIGRADDVLITGGVKMAPTAVEATLTHLPGVTDVVLTGVPDDEWGQSLVAVIATAGSPDPATLRAAARTAHGPSAVPRTVVLVDELPLRGPGKPDRVAIRELAVRALAGSSAGDVIDLRPAAH